MALWDDGEKYNPTRGMDPHQKQMELQRCPILLGQEV
jgi:hypothetical protein